jgi:hypothetical protein
VIFPTKDQIVATQARLIAEFGGDATEVELHDLSLAIASSAMTATKSMHGCSRASATNRPPDRG